MREIFRESGESSFRAVEREVIGQISQTPRLVVALGGGTLTDPETFKSITASGILVYLRVSPDQLFRRVQAKSDRPLLMDLEGNRLNEGELRQRIIHLYEQREPMYNKADLVFEADEAGVGLAVDKIVRKISAYIE